MDCRRIGNLGKEKGLTGWFTGLRPPTVHLPPSFPLLLFFTIVYFPSFLCRVSFLLGFPQDSLHEPFHLSWSFFNQAGSVFISCVSALWTLVPFQNVFSPIPTTSWRLTTNWLSRLNGQWRLPCFKTHVSYIKTSRTHFFLQSLCIEQNPHCPENVKWDNNKV